MKLMAPCADRITTALESTVRSFSAKKTRWIGNPVRDVLYDRPEAAKKFFGIPVDAPVIFAMGGGTGSETINRLIIEALPSWKAQWHVIHVTGKERPGDLAERAAKAFPNYHVYKFFTDEMAYAYAAADIVVARGGFGTLSELAMLKKCALIVPMAGTHQEENAAFFEQRGAIKTLHSDHESGHRLARMVADLLAHQQERMRMGENLHAVLPTAANKDLETIITELVTG